MSESEARMTPSRPLSGGYYSREELLAAGFRRVGEHVQIHERANIFGAEHISLGDHVRIDQFTNLAATSEVQIGSCVHIAAHCHLSITSGLTIGSYSAIGAGSRIITSSGDVEGELFNLPFPHIPIEFRREVLHGPVTFKGHNLMGMNSIVMPGVTFEEGSAVGMMSVVMNDLQAWSFYLGAPARKVKDRSRRVVELALQLERSGA
jgi:acetyltransferase-like isoleucine patch superfamily enzyme